MPTYEVCIHIHRPHKPPHTRTARGWVYSTPKKYEPLRKGPGPSVGWRISPHIRVREGKTHRTHQCWLPFASNHTALPPSHRVQTAAPGGARVVLVGVLDGKAGPRVRGVPVAGTAAASIPRTLPVPVTQPPAALHKGMATGAHLKTGKQAWKGSLGRLEAEPGFTPRPSPPPTSPLTDTSCWYQAQRRPSVKTCWVDGGVSTCGMVVGGWPCLCPYPAAAPTPAVVCWCLTARPLFSPRTWTSSPAFVSGNKPCACGLTARPKQLASKSHRSASG